MGDVIQFRRRKPPAKGEQLTLCRSGFHKWRVVNGTRFDTKEGKLVTTYRCVRCGAVRTDRT